MNHLKNILFYTDTPHYGGAEKQMELLAKYLKSLGYSVFLACGAYSDLKQRLSDLKKHYTEVYLLPTIHKHDPRHYFALKKLLRSESLGFTRLAQVKEDARSGISCIKHTAVSTGASDEGLSQTRKPCFDLIHIHLWNPGACRYAFWAASHAKTPIVTTEHDPFELSGLKRKIKLKCLHKTDQIITISMDNFRQLSDYGESVKKRLNLINNGIELDRFLDNIVKASLPVHDGDTVITCVAELHPRKGHKYLLEAFRKLQAEMPKLHLVLVGAGPAEKELKAKYGSLQNLHFLGWRDDIPQILKASDLFVLPTLNEAFGLVLLEAMASLVAVIATDAGGPKDIIEDGKTGCLVPPGDSEALADAIRTLLLNPDQKRDMEKAALERVKTHFTAERMAMKTKEVYEKCLISNYSN